METTDFDVGDLVHKVLNFRSLLLLRRSKLFPKPCRDLIDIEEYEVQLGYDFDAF